MNILFIGGHSNAGKTTLFDSIKSIFEEKDIIKEKSNGSEGLEVEDYIALVQDKNKKYFILNSSSDEEGLVDALIEFVDTCKNEGFLVDTLILAIRSDGDWMRDYLLEELKKHQLLSNEEEIIEFPLARINGNNSVATYEWYKETAKKMILWILSQSPFSLNI